MEENYFHAVVEAYKGLAERIREKTGSTSDGFELMRTRSFERPSSQSYKVKVPHIRLSTPLPPSN